MVETPEIALQKKLLRWSAYFTWAVLIVGFLVLVGWGLDIEILKRPLLKLVAMNPVTAVLFILSGISYIILKNKDGSSKNKITGRLIAFIIIATAILRILDILLKYNIPIDQFLFAGKLKDEFLGGMTNHMALNTAICFILSGISLLYLHRKAGRGKLLSQYLSLVIGVLAFFSILGYLYQVKDFYSILVYLPMAIHTALCFLFLSLAILFADPGKGIMKTLTGSQTGSVIARTLIPVAILVPLTMGWLRLLGDWNNIFTSEFGVAIHVLSIIIIFLVIIWYNMVLLNKRDFQRKESENALKESEEKLRVVLDSARIGAWDLNLVKDTAWRSLLHDQIFGYEQIFPEWGYEIFLTHVIPEDREYVKQRFEEAYSKGSFSMECRIKRVNDNSIRWISAQGLAYKNEKGELIKMMGVIIDINDQKKAEEKFRSLLDAAPDATVIVNEKGRIHMINHQAENLFGYSRDEMIGHLVEILVPQELHNKHKQHREGFFKAAKVRSMGVGLELNAVRKNGIRFPVEISLSPIQMEDGMLVSASVRDITERKNLENELRKTNDELEAFTYSVSHDLRAPLRGIIGFTAILEEDYSCHLDDEAKRVTSIIKENAKRMGLLIDDLLSFSRMGKQELLKAHIDSQAMISEVIYELTHHTKEKHIKWEIHELPAVSADIKTIRQVWINLISNAIKYSGNKENPQIEIGSIKQEDQIIFFIKDNGVGFDIQYSDKLFKVFQRLHSSDEFEGTGVGLALVEKIISKHGGKVWAESEINIGATFYFSLPAQENKEQQKSNIYET